MHRDLRAANVLVAGERPLHIVLTDFGVSHRLRAYAQVLYSDELMIAITGRRLLDPPFLSFIPTLALVVAC